MKKTKVDRDVYPFGETASKGKEKDWQSTSFAHSEGEESTDIQPIEPGGYFYNSLDPRLKVEKKQS